jgi:ribosomal protein L34
MASKLRRVRKYKWLKRLRTHWFRERMKKRTGRKILSNRRKKGRKQLTPQRP